jgi:hypothetical protein
MSCIAGAQTTVFDFTGTVTASDFSSIASGMQITGSYTIDLANSDPAISNPVDTTQPWTQAVAGGAALGTPVPTGTVFSSALKGGSFGYESPGPSAYGSLSQVSGDPSSFYNGTEIEYTTSTLFTISSFEIDNPTALTYTAAGAPLFGAGATGSGSLFVGSYVDQDGTSVPSGSLLSYSIESFTAAMAAPELEPGSAAGVLTLFCGALLILRTRRSARV